MTDGERLDFLDALRGYAILGVILTLAASLTGVGGPLRLLTDAAGTGVQLFFVISAVTIFLTFEKAKARDPNPVRSFFIKRLFRIVPVYWFGIVLYTVVYGLGSRGWKEGPELWHYPLHFTLTNLLHPATMSSVVPGGWSISCEVFFYLTVPLWFLAVRNVRQAAVFVAVSIIGGQVVVHVLRKLLDPTFAPWTGELAQYWYRSFPSQLGVFAIGMLLFFTLRDLRPWTERLRSPLASLATLALGTVIYALATFHRTSFVPHHYVFAAAYFVFGLALSQRPWLGLVNPVTTRIGRISYSGYIVHFLVLKQLQLHMPLPASHTLACFILYAAGLTFTLPLAWCGFKLIEQPCTNAAHRLIKRLAIRRMDQALA